MSDMLFFFWYAIGRKFQKYSLNFFYTYHVAIKQHKPNHVLWYKLFYVIYIKTQNITNQAPLCPSSVCNICNKVHCSSHHFCINFYTVFCVLLNVFFQVLPLTFLCKSRSRTNRTNTNVHDITWCFDLVGRDAFSLFKFKNPLSQIAVLTDKVIIFWSKHEMFFNTVRFSNKMQ